MEKGFHTGQAYDQKKTISCQDMSLLWNSWIFFSVSWHNDKHIQYTKVFIEETDKNFDFITEIPFRSHFWGPVHSKIEEFRHSNRRFIKWCIILYIVRIFSSLELVKPRVIPLKALNSRTSFFPSRILEKYSTHKAALYMTVLFSTWNITVRFSLLEKVWSFSDRKMIKLLKFDNHLFPPLRQSR